MSQMLSRNETRRGARTIDQVVGFGSARSKNRRRLAAVTGRRKQCCGGDKTCSSASYYAQIQTAFPGCPAMVRFAMVMIQDKGDQSTTALHGERSCRKLEAAIGDGRRQGQDWPNSLPP